MFSHKAMDRVFVYSSCALVILFSQFSFSSEVDIRAASPLSQFSSSVDYVLSIRDCLNLTSVVAEEDGAEFIYSPEDFVASSTSDRGCELTITKSGVDKFQPSVVINYLGSESLNYSESFYVEHVKPEFSVKDVAIIGEVDEQAIAITLNASDDVDLSYASVSVLGLRASTLRSKGGLIDEAAKNNFVDSSVTVFPSASGGDFSWVFPLDGVLSASEIASDAIVLLDVSVVDSSGNSNDSSQVLFLGENVDEEVFGVVAAPSKLLFHSLLEVGQIAVNADFKFRGLTPLIGATAGVNYKSSDESSIVVTNTGVVYPLKVTDDDVFITVAYGGFSQVIPVEVSLTKSIVGLSVDNGGEPFTLNRLNYHHDFPEVSAVSRDTNSGLIEVAPLNPNRKVVFSAPEELAEFIKIAGNGVRSAVEIPVSAPLTITVALENSPTVTGSFGLVASDAPPSASIKVASSVRIDDVLEYIVVANDDVAVSEVRVWMDGSLVSQWTAPPYSGAMPISNDFKGRVLEFKASVIDSKGQEIYSDLAHVSILESSVDEVPEATFYEPIDGARLIESVPVVLSIISPLEKDEFSTAIERVEFFSDGKKSAESLFPIFTSIDTDADGKDERYEKWAARLTLPSIVLDETATAVSARVFTEGGNEDLPAKVIRVKKNEVPISSIVAPAEDSAVTVGQVMRVGVEISDDTLALGTEVSFYINGELFETRQVSTEKTLDFSRVGREVGVEWFEVDIEESWLGSSLVLKATAIDYHDKLTESQPVEVLVKSDQPPSVALSAPVEGEHLISGTAVEFRASASDDLGIERIDFFVNDVLVGSDANTPYSMIYNAPEGVRNTQALLLHAEVFDSSGQSSISNRVSVSLGDDFQSPVLSLASPEISQTEAGDSLAVITESKPFVFKVTGYDNVLVDHLEVTGIRHIEGQGLLLTGLEADILDGDIISPNQIGGVLNAFNLAKVVSAPEFKDLQGVLLDRYLVAVTAYDSSGNASVLNAVIAVQKDKAPTVVNVETNRNSFYVHETIQFDVLAKDDNSVSELEIRAYIDDSTEAISLVHNETSGLVPAKTILDQFFLDLSELGLSNIRHTIRYEVIATDNFGSKSTAYESGKLNSSPHIELIEDDQGPRLDIISPSLAQEYFTNDSQ